MSYPNPPIGWAHTWLAPLWTWLVGLVKIVNRLAGASFQPVRLLTAGALPANTYVAGTQTKTANANGALGNIDGVAAAVGDRVWDQSAATGSERGLFRIVSIGGAGKWSMVRDDDAKASADFTEGKKFSVEEGVANGGSTWMLTHAAPFVLDADTPTIVETADDALAGDVAGPLEATVIQPHAVTPSKTAALTRFEVHLGSNGAGAVAFVGAKVGDLVVSVLNLTDDTDDTAGFEAAITVIDQIQQTAAVDKSAKKLAITLQRQS